ncbi:MAG: T9SS type A sorting domain-containing protein [Saprospiraceae bacterium]|nr:T9SS type A sorting domain-containing protein [Saprospiraceae bacterium]
MRKILLFNNQFNWVQCCFMAFVLLCLNTNLNGQCNCDLLTIDPPQCQQETELTFQHGTNITNELKSAILANCRIRIKNTYFSSSSSGSYGNVTFFVSPTVFSNIQDKEIILEQGVTLQGVQGGFSDCSQSVFTFDGNDVRNIVIRGEYDICELGDQPTISAGKPNYEDIPEQGYLVAADGDGEPYLNANDEPNYVYSDGDANPYYDDNANPNLIVNNNFPKVEANCDYNDYVCNRDIIVWCPFSLEGRHLIALHGVDNFSVHNIRFEKSAGGDAIHITDDRDFNPSQVVKMNNSYFYKNARTGVVFVNAKCSKVDSSTFVENGKYIPADFIELRGAIAFHQNSNEGSVTAYNGKETRWSQRINEVRHSQFENNAANEFSFDLPLRIQDCNNVNIKIIDNCVPFASDVIAFKSVSEDQVGQIRFSDFTVFDFTNSVITVDPDWTNGGNLRHRFTNFSVTAGAPQSGYEVNNQSFCQNLFVADWCQTNVSDDLCGQIFSCSPDNNYSCLDGGTCCELSSNIETNIETTCECDFLFMVDESGSVMTDEWENMECTIFNLMTDLNALCTDTTQCFISEEEGYDQACVDSINGLVRFAVVQWSSRRQQYIYSDFDSIPYHFTRKYGGSTWVDNAFTFVNDEIDGGGLNPKTRINGLDPTKCLKTLLFTDADCDDFNATAIAEALQLATESLSTIDIVDYDGGYQNCQGAIDVAVNGGIFPAAFDCEDSGIVVDDFIDSVITHVITIDVDQCSNPDVEWTVSNGGEILDSNADGTQITVTNTGLYEVVVLCESGCVNILEESFDIDGLGINNIVEDTYTDTRTVVNRDQLIDGQWLSPGEREQYELGLLESNNNQGIMVYPNPSSGSITFENPFGAESGTFEIIDIQGRIVKKGKFGPNTSKIDSEFVNAPSGVLLLKIKSDKDGTESVVKFINQN